MKKIRCTLCSQITDDDNATSFCKTCFNELQTTFTKLGLKESKVDRLIDLLSTFEPFETWTSEQILTNEEDIAAMKKIIRVHAHNRGQVVIPLKKR